MSTITKKHHLKILAERDTEIARLKRDMATVKQECTYWLEHHTKLKNELDLIQRKKGVAVGEKAQARNQMEKAVQRAHRELCIVRSTENNPALLSRIVGIAQGILAGALDGQHTDGALRAEPFDPYRAEREDKEMRHEYGISPMHSALGRKTFNQTNP